MTDNQHYQAIKEYYGTQCAKRSGVPLLNHIDEGLFILETIGATIEAKEAFCLHPLLQADSDFTSSLQENSIFSSYNLNQHSIILAMEYRSVANAYLSFHYQTKKDTIKLSPIKCVNDMLIADKIQNRKDFEIYHMGSHDRSEALEQYFKNWLKALDVSEAKYKRIVNLLSIKAE